MSAPAALIISKIIYPETENSKTSGNLTIEIENTSSNAMEALGNGASDGLKLAANVGAMLIAFISIVALINYLLSIVGTSIDQILSIIFKPLAWTMGIPWSEAGYVGSLMGEKIVFTELIAFGDLQSMISKNQLSERSAIISSYALCGFANFGSIGIQLGGIGGIAPQRKKELANPNHDPNILHKQFCEEQIFGSEIMPFGTHLTAANLAAINPASTIKTAQIIEQDLSLIHI